MIEILKYISSGLIIISFICYLLNILINKSKKISDDDGFNITKDIIQEYDMINIIENTGVISYYNPRRGVIKLSSKSYYGSDLSHIGIGLMEAGVSVIDKKGNKFINIFKKIVSNLKILYIFPIITVIVNFITYTKGDAKIGLILVIISTLVIYMINSILINANDWVCNNIKKVKSVDNDGKDKIISYLNNIINLNKIIFLGELISIITMVAIFIDFKL